MAGRKECLTILVGADMDSDFKQLFSGKPISEIKQAKNALYLDSFEQLSRLLSPKRIDLLRYLKNTQGSKRRKSVSEIAKKLNRHQEAVSRDVNYLKALGFVSLKRVKQSVYAMPAFNSIKIKIC